MFLDEEKQIVIKTSGNCFLIKNVTIDINKRIKINKSRIITYEIYIIA